MLGFYQHFLKYNANPHLQKHTIVCLYLSITLYLSLLATIIHYKNGMWHGIGCLVVRPNLVY